jgi:Fe-S cluster assembly protein SufD
MQSILFRPSAEPDLAPPPPSRPALVGADAEQWTNGTLFADFFQTETSSPASVFFDGKEPVGAQLALRFFTGARRLFFLRVERVPRAEIALDLTLDEDAVVTLVALVKEPRAAEVGLKIAARLGERARLDVAFLHLGSGHFESRIEARLEKRQASARLAMLEVMRGEAQSRSCLESIADAPETAGVIVVRNVLYGNAKARIEGRPTITARAAGSENHLDQSGLLLSSAARLTALPLLSVANNAVRASHKSATARLDAEDRFYLRSRGLSDRDADALLLDGFLAEVLSAVHEASIRNCTAEAVHHFLENER